MDKPRTLRLIAALSRLLIVVVVPTALSGCASRAELRFLTWAQVADRPLPNVSERSGPFQASIERRYEGDLEARLLALVEATYPLYPNSIILRGFSRPEGDVEPKWWASEFDGFRIPVAVTRSAVAHYLDLIRSFRAGDFTGPNGIEQQTARLEYTAEIEPASTALEHPEALQDLANKFIVRMEMTWTSDCGSLCGLQFTRTRTAVVSRDGIVLEVLEDPLAPILID